MDSRRGQVLLFAFMKIKVKKQDLTPLLVIVGPTASGKTQLGIDIAKRFNGEVISVDSRQVYRGMDIGTAKPNAKCKMQNAKFPLPIWVVDGIPHWGIDLVEPDEEYSVADFKKYADQKIIEISKRGKLPILVGGTGLWVRAVVDNLNLTETPPNRELRTVLEKRDLNDLNAEYKRLDPIGAEVIDRDNKRRVVRALEVTLVTGKPFSAQVERGTGTYDVLQIGLLVDRGILNERINQRVDEMVANGLVDEVRQLSDQYGTDIDAMTGIGYRQISLFLEGKRPLVDCIEETKKATRAYAKRQMTWFRRDPRINWIPVLQATYYEQFLHPLLLRFLSSPDR